MSTAHRWLSRFLIGIALLLGCASPFDRTVTAPASTGQPEFATQNVSQWSAPVNLGPVVNSSFNDTQPALSKDGLSLFFASNRLENDADQVLDNNIWVSHRECTDDTDIACAWTTPVELPAPINTAFGDAAPGLSRDEHWLFFTSTRAAFGSNDLWGAYRTNVHDDFGWERVVNLGPGINTAAPEIAPSYFEGDEGGAPELYFNRGNPQGDIYVSELASDGTWGVARPVSALNTLQYSEQRPSIKQNGLEIYFWSDRSGTAQIWQSTRSTVKDDWSSPTMVGTPISDQSTIHPFIYSHGNTEILLFVRNAPNRGLDLFMSKRTPGGKM